MLMGEIQSTTPGQRTLAALLILVFISPWLLMGGGMVVAGFLALEPREDIGELWICFPAGLALLGFLAVVMYYTFVWVPSVTISRFAFNGRELKLETPRFGCVTAAVADLRSVTEVRNRRRSPGRKLRGWWLRLEGIGSLYLCRNADNAHFLVSQLTAIRSISDAEQSGQREPPITRY
jgi:energy-coupling factor transporter transmembrane protein EcfT